MDEVDILNPPMFEATGERLTGTEAILAGKWLGSANVWIYRFTNNGTIELLYQEREPNSPWMPGKLDVAAGGYFKPGEAATSDTRLHGALRELKEELGIAAESKRLRYITRRLNVGISQKGNERKSCCSIYALELGNDDAVHLARDIESGVLEVTATYWFELTDILRLHEDVVTKIVAKRIAADGNITNKEISAASFCPNYDDYLFTMPAMIAALVATRD